MTTIQAGFILPGDLVRRPAYAGGWTSSRVRAVTPRTLNDGTRVVDVSYGNGQGATA